MELDSPERVANEVLKFFDEARPDYFDEDEDTTEIADAAVSDEPDEGFAGNWIISFKGPMGEQKMPLEITMRESKVYGILELMGKRQNITYGIATKAGFDFNVAVKIAFRKGTARIRGTRDGDSISGLITLPVGDVDFTGTRA